MVVDAGSWPSWVGAVLLALTPVAHAAGRCGGAVGLSSDNLYRGTSLTDGRPAWFADGHCEFADGWVAGASISTVHLPTRGRNAQLGLYLDRRWQLDDDWSAKIGAVHYDAFHHGRAEGLRYDELNAVIGYRGFWRASIAWSPNATDLYFGGAGTTHRTVWAETTFHRPLAGRLSADLGLGIALPGGQGERSYRYGSIGASYAIGDVYFYASRIWTDSLSWSFDYLGETYTATSPSNAQWVGSVVWSF
ncbi:MAG: hypothetical protein ACTHK2_10785 [Dokdonella sp.]|uniref:hypothetical protein n=1 Tax=Dokdonella sp. TaxID=2291710 RepID=UPI003F7F4ABA